MPDLTPAEQLAVEIDRFTYGYDTDLYRDNSQSMTENVSEIAEALKQRDMKKALVSGQGKDHEMQENNKNNQREM